jgi:hypothetical protein
MLRVQLRVLGSMSRTLLVSFTTRRPQLFDLQSGCASATKPWDNAVHCVQCRPANPNFCTARVARLHHVMQHAAVPVDVAHSILVCQ